MQIFNLFFLILAASCNLNFARAGSNEKSKAWLEVNAEFPSVTTLPSGLQYKVIKSGKGKYHPSINSPTKCHYEGRLIDGTVFDSSYDRGAPSTFAPNQVIKGWTEAMQLMVEGDKWELYIPSELGYGDRGSPPKIGGGDALIFIMEMIEITGNDKVFAVKCIVDTLEDCDEKEKAYVEKARGKFDTEDKLKMEMKRINKISASGSVTSSAQDWARDRVQILTQLKMKFEGKEEEL